MALGPQDRDRLKAAAVAGDTYAAVLSLNGAAWFLRTSPERLQALGVVRVESSRSYVELGAARDALRADSADHDLSLAREIARLADALERARALLERASLRAVRSRRPRPYRRSG